jgi:hypothetical protein
MREIVQTHAGHMLGTCTHVNTCCTTKSRTKGCPRVRGRFRGPRQDTMSTKLVITSTPHVPGLSGCRFRNYRVAGVGSSIATSPSTGTTTTGSGTCHVKLHIHGAA